MTFDLGLNSPACTERCGPFLTFWTGFWAEHSQLPVALITCRDYLDGLSRNGRKLAHRGLRRYEFRRFDLNTSLADVWAINTSKTETSQGPLRGWFTNPPGAEPNGTYCPIHGLNWYGGYDQHGTLRGYWSVAKLNRLGTSDRLFRHAYGSELVLHGLIAWICEHGDVDHVTYHTMDAVPYSGRPEFKRRIGCHETTLVVQ